MLLFMRKFISHINDAMRLFNDRVSPYRAALKLDAQKFRFHSPHCRIYNTRISNFPL